MKTREEELRASFIGVRVIAKPFVQAREDIRYLLKIIDNLRAQIKSLENNQILEQPKRMKKIKLFIIPYLSLPEKQLSLYGTEDSMILNSEDSKYFFDWCGSIQEIEVEIEE